MKLINRLMTGLLNLARRSNLLTGLYHPLKLTVIFKNPRKARFIAKAEPYSLSHYPKLGSLYDLALRIEKSGLEGSYVKCGVYYGGSAAMHAYATRNNNQRHLWLFDSFE